MTNPGWITFVWNDSLPDAAQELAAIGYRGVEILYNSSLYEPYRERPETLRDALSDTGVHLVGIVVTADLYNPETVDREIADCSSVAQAVAAIGGDILFVVPGVRQFANSQHGLTDEQYERMASSLDRVGLECRKQGVTCCLNPHIRQVIERRHEINRILGMTDPDLVKLSYDPSHIYIGGWDPVEAAEKHRERIACVHLRNLKDGYYSNPETGEIDMDRVLQTLKRGGYSGWILPCLPAYAHYGKSEAEVARDNFRYLEARLW